MTSNTNKPLETLVSFSDYKTEKIKSVQMSLENNMCLVVDNDGKSSGVAITIKDTITDSVEISGFITQENLKSLIKILNVMYRQAASNATSGV